MLQYVILDISTVHPSRRRLFARIQTFFFELNSHGATITRWLIDAVVESNGQTYYKYYDFDSPRPTHDDLFEYSLCRTINAQIWSRWDAPVVLPAQSHADFHAASAKYSEFQKLPKTCNQMMIHQNHQELYDAFIIEWNRWIEK